LSFDILSFDILSSSSSSSMDPLPAKQAGNG
jgi:hypothetical protein